MFLLPAINKTALNSVRFNGYISQRKMDITEGMDDPLWANGKCQFLIQVLVDKIRRATGEKEIEYRLSPELFEGSTPEEPFPHLDLITSCLLKPVQYHFNTLAMQGASTEYDMVIQFRRPIRSPHVSQIIITIRWS